MQNRQYGVREERLRKQFTANELKYIEEVDRCYTPQEIIEHMELHIGCRIVLDGDPEKEEYRIKCYKEMLKMKLK